MLRIAVLDDYQQAAAGLADWASVGAADFFHAPIPAAALADTLRPYDVVCLMRERTLFPAALIDALPNLKLIVTTGGRNAAIDTAAAAARGVPVCGTASRAPATAQAAMTLILAASRNLAPEAASMRNGGWQVGLGRDLHGLTLGLIGLGRLGAAVADLARPFGVKLTAWSANLTDERCAEVGVARAATLRDLLTNADVISIHMVLSDRTRGLIGAEQLSWMKPDALLVNTSRGPIVDSAALLDALRQGRPGAAALDVYDEEPMPAAHPLRDRALIDAGRLLLTPHIGYVARQTYEIFYRETVECIAAWAAGAPVRRIA
jgi:phosphoglycerate dehydrogenase-like enzyme